MSCFGGKMREYRDVSIDRFDNYQGNRNLESSVYFLSHFHKDHTAGMSSPRFLERLKSSRRVYVYCSEVTKILMMGDEEYQHLEKYVRTLETDVPSRIAIPNEYTDEDAHVTVTLIPAGHCPGSVMFLFEGPEGVVLYSGDFRWEGNEVTRVPWFKSGDSVKDIQSIYVDTTFCIPEAFYIPSRADCADCLCDLISDWLRESPRHLVHISSKTTYGHEHLMKEVADRLLTQVHVSARKLSLYEQIGELRGVFTADPTQTRVHACSWVSDRDPSSRLPCGYCLPSVADSGDGGVARVLTVRPSTMWFTQGVQVKDIYVKTGSLHRVCYSFHSSYSEVRDLVTYLRPRRAFPNVRPVNYTMDQVQARLNQFLRMSHREHTVNEDSTPTKPLGVLRRSRTMEHIKGSLCDSEGLVFGDLQTPKKRRKRSSSDSLPGTPRSKVSVGSHSQEIAEGDSDVVDSQSSYTPSHHGDSEMDLTAGGDSHENLEVTADGVDLPQSTESFMAYLSGEEDDEDYQEFVYQNKLLPLQSQSTAECSQSESLTDHQSCPEAECVTGNEREFVSGEVKDSQSRQESEAVRCQDSVLASDDATKHFSVPEFNYTKGSQNVTDSDKSETNNQQLSKPKEVNLSTDEPDNSSDMLQAGKVQTNNSEHATCNSYKQTSIAKVSHNTEIPEISKRPEGKVQPSDRECEIFASGGLIKSTEQEEPNEESKNVDEEVTDELLSHTAISAASSPIQKNADKVSGNSACSERRLSKDLGGTPIDEIPQNVIKISEHAQGLNGESEEQSGSWEMELLSGSNEDNFNDGPVDGEEHKQANPAEQDGEEYKQANPAKQDGEEYKQANPEEEDIGGSPCSEEKECARESGQTDLDLLEDDQTDNQHQTCDKLEDIDEDSQIQCSSEHSESWEMELLSENKGASSESVPAEGTKDLQQSDEDRAITDYIKGAEDGSEAPVDGQIISRNCKDPSKDQEVPVETGIYGEASPVECCGQQSESWELEPLSENPDHPRDDTVVKNEAKRDSVSEKDKNSGFVHSAVTGQYTENNVQTTKESSPSSQNQVEITEPDECPASEALSENKAADTKSDGDLAEGHEVQAEQKFANMEAECPEEESCDLELHSEDLDGHDLDGHESELMKDTIALDSQNSQVHGHPEVKDKNQEVCTQKGEHSLVSGCVGPALADSEDSREFVSTLVVDSQSSVEEISQGFEASRVSPDEGIVELSDESDLTIPPESPGEQELEQSSADTDSDIEIIYSSIPSSSDETAHKNNKGSDFTGGHSESQFQGLKRDRDETEDCPPKKLRRARPDLIIRPRGIKYTPRLKSTKTEKEVMFVDLTDSDYEESVLVEDSLEENQADNDETQKYLSPVKTCPVTDDTANSPT